MTDTYRCAVCGEVFDKGWSNEEAEAERALMYGDAVPVEECSTLCEDCYMKLPDWARSIAG
jgi:rubredoxin